MRRLSGARECLELALRNWAVGQHGVWGGTVPAERERLRSGRVAQLTRVLARNRNADFAASRDATGRIVIRRPISISMTDNLTLM